MNKDVLIALIAKDVRELQTMTDGMDQMREIPVQYLSLAHNKSKELTQNIEGLIEYLNKASEEEENIKQEIEKKEKEEEQRRVQEEAARKAEEERIKAAAEQQRIEAERAAEEERRAAEERERREQEERDRKAREEAKREEAARKEKEEKLRQAEEEYNKAKKEAEAIREEEHKKDTHIIAEEKQQPTLAESIKTAESLMDKLSRKEDNTLATALNNQKIEDLKTAFSIADRFRFQRELFAGDGEEMGKALTDFNSFDAIEEAIEYIEENFDWNEDNSTVADFMQLLHRRYL